MNTSAYVISNALYEHKRHQRQITTTTLTINNARRREVLSRCLLRPWAPASVEALSNATLYTLSRKCVCNALHRHKRTNTITHCHNSTRSSPPSQTSPFAGKFYHCAIIDAMSTCEQETNVHVNHLTKDKLSFSTITLLSQGIPTPKFWGHDHLRTRTLSLTPLKNN